MTCATKVRHITTATQRLDEEIAKLKNTCMVSKSIFIQILYFFTQKSYKTQISCFLTPNYPITVLQVSQMNRVQFGRVPIFLIFFEKITKYRKNVPRAVLAGKPTKIDGIAYFFYLHVGNHLTFHLSPK